MASSRFSEPGIGYLRRWQSAARSLAEVVGALAKVVGALTKLIEQSRILHGNNRLVYESDDKLNLVKGSTLSFHKIKTPTRSSSET
jgi:hypothetical protein